MTPARRDQLWGLVVLGLVFGVTAAVALGFPSRARLFPVFVGVLGFGLALGELWVGARRPDVDGAESLMKSARGIAPYLMWLLALFLFAWLVGFVSAAGLFVAAFLRREARASWTMALVSLFAVCGFLVGVGSVFSLHWPGSLFDPFLLLGIL